MSQSKDDGVKYEGAPDTSVKDTGDYVQVGDRFQFWGNSVRTVVAVRKYNGPYKDLVDVILLLTSPNTRSGYIEMSYKQGPKPT